MAMVCVTGGRECDGCMACQEEVLREFHEEVRQRGSVAAGARGKKSRFRAKPGCSLPSDHLTEAQWQAKNGPVTVWRGDAGV